MNDNSSWLDATAKLPIAFALVREDALLDLEVLASLPSEARVLMVASGGCTAAALAASGHAAHLHLVDPNPAQLALARLKLHLLQTADRATRRTILGHDSLPPLLRQQRLAECMSILDLPSDRLGTPTEVAARGPDHAGRYEALFAQLRARLETCRSELSALLDLRDPKEQARRIEPNTALGQALDRAYDEVLSLPFLVRLFGEGATRNRVEPFARHFARRTRQALATLPAADNPYLWLMLQGELPPGFDLPWLSAPIPERMPSLAYSQAFMADALAAAARDYDLVHLSNILDWLTPEEARQTLELAGRVLRPGGIVFLRQLNSTLEIPSLGGPFAWQADVAAGLHRRDRSFFYRFLHLGRKQ